MVSSSSCEQIENMLSASNEWPQNYHQIKEGDQDDDQIRSLNTTTTTTTTTTTSNNSNSNNNNKMMMMMAETKEAEGGGARLMEKPSQEQIQHQQQQQPLKCPRCESTNTKFCYYNNYSLSQPRHFCKACKRYWTRGGTLRSVPVGGGCRKNKRIRRNPNFSNSTTSTTNSSSNNSSSNNMSESNTFNSHQSFNPSGGAHLISPLLYGLPTNLVPPTPTHHHHHASPHEAIINGFPFSSSYDNLGGIGLGFSSGGMILGGGDHRNGYSTTTPKQILQDLISNSNPTFLGSKNSNTTSSTTITTTTATLPTMSMSSLLTSSLEQHQQKFNFETLFPYDLDLQIKGVGSHGSEGAYMKEDSVKLEGNNDHLHGQCQTQNGFDDDDQQQQPMIESDPSILWNNHNSNGTSIGVNWLDPNYSSLGSSSVPSLI